MDGLPIAREIRLSKTKPLAPPFHKHIARGKLTGGKWEKGDKVIVYIITDTDPDGPVLVTEETLIHFDEE